MYVYGLVFVVFKFIIVNSENNISFIIYWQEKMKGKNKLVPRLLGVTKESILRVDEKTKEVWMTSLVQSC